MSVSHTTQIFGFETDLVLSLCESIGTPRSLTVYLLVKNGEWDQLLALQIDWKHYDNHRSFSDDYLVTSVLSKNPRVPIAINKREVAISKFWAAESSCAETNDRLSKYSDSVISTDPDIHLAIHYAREFIREVLGPLTRADLTLCEREMSFGPGATTSVSGVVTQGKKYSPRSLDTTPRLLDFALFCLPPGWRKSVKGFTIRESSKLTTVPKNAKTERVICIEPDLNIYVQKGIGSLIRSKLLQSGLDIRTQEINQYLASCASSMDLCTIDLSAASDSISRQLVWLLLPERWVELLHMARVDSTTVDGVNHQLEKWSSMGNGYTFELETLIFWAVLNGVQRVTGSKGPVVAYGDDLICPVQDFEVNQRVLNFLGFKTNVEKTFGKGRFHESCGTDWFDGYNVRPFFLRSDHHDFPTICYIYANGFRRWANHRCGGLFSDRRLLPVWLRCFTAVGKPDRHRIPDGFGDVGFIEEFDRAAPSVGGRRSRQHDTGRRLISEPLAAKVDSLSHPRGWGGYEFSFRHIGSRCSVISEQGCLTAFLNGVSTEWTFGKESLRGRYARAVTRKGYCLQWPALGPWG